MGAVAAMRISRRNLLASSAAAALVSQLPAGAWRFGPAPASGIPTGWNTLPLGAGGQVDGIHIANDGSMVCRGDVFGAFVWSGTSAMSSITDPAQKWRQVVTLSAFSAPGVFTANPWEYVQAPGNSNYHYLMTGSTTSTNYALYYSTDKGITFVNMGTDVPYPSAGLQESYKVAVDPNNEKVAYWATSSAGSVSVYTTFDRTAGHTWPTLSAAKTNSTTQFPACTTACGGGIAFDTSMGTITIGGQVLTKRIILCVGGSGIYETTDAGQNWTEIAASAFGTSTFHVSNGFMDGNFSTNANSVNNYFCTTPELSKTWRYFGGGSGGWKDITPFAGYGGNLLLVDPRAGQAYVTVYGPNGSGVGYTTTNSTATTPSWGGSTGGQTTNLRAASYDLPYLNYIFGQSGYTNGVLGVIDSNGTAFWCGNQSIWYYTAIPNYAVSLVTTSNSFGRGQEGTVSCDVLVPPGGTVPILACQDLGAPMLGNTFTTYPTDMVVRGQETLASSLEFAASDPTFIVSRMTGQVGSTADVTSYSTDSGKTWTQIAAVPTALWQSSVTGSVSGTTLTVTAFLSGNTIFPNTLTFAGSTYLGLIQPYGTGGTTGTGGLGTYTMSFASTVASTTINPAFQNNSGQAVAVDHDHWVMIPTGQDGQYSIPVYTTNATGAATWQFCQQSGGGNMPAANWSTSNSWQGGDSPKVLAVGYGVDLGTVWLGQYVQSTNTVVLWRSTDSGATFSTIASASCSTIVLRLFLYSVYGHPNEVWMAVGSSGGSGDLLWHVTNANTSSATMTPMNGTNLPAAATLLNNFTIGAAPSGTYPYLYATFEPAGMGSVPSDLYQGVWNGSSLSWSLYGPSGANQGKQIQLPGSFQYNGIANLRADWNVPGRIYATNNGMGFAYYNP